MIGAAAFVGFLLWDWYLLFTSGTRALEPVFDFLFVKHRAIALPFVALVLMVALFVDTVRAKRDPKLGMTRFWRGVCLIVLVIALLVGVSDYWVR